MLVVQAAIERAGVEINIGFWSSSPSSLGIAMLKLSALRLRGTMRCDNAVLVFFHRSRKQ